MHLHFVYFTCEFTVPDDPTEEVGNGTWKRWECQGDDFWIPEADANGGSECQPWDSLSEKWQHHYKNDRVCNPEETCDLTDGGFCDEDEVAGNATCGPSTKCHCGRCVGSSRPQEVCWSRLTCVGTEPAGNPRDDWSWSWEEAGCGAHPDGGRNPVYNPDASPQSQACGEWDDLTKEHKKHYDDTCFPVPTTCPTEGDFELCPGDRDRPSNGSSCGTGFDKPRECRCGYCEEFFVCHDERKSEDPRDGWEGHWRVTECGKDTFFSQQCRQCERWIDVRPDQLKETYKHDANCIEPHKVCEEEADGPCSATYTSKFGTEVNRHTCLAGRFYNPKVKDCTACNDVVNANGSHCRLQGSNCVVVGAN